MSYFGDLSREEFDIINRRRTDLIAKKYGDGDSPAHLTEDEELELERLQGALGIELGKALAPDTEYTKRMAGEIDSNTLPKKERPLQP